MSTPIGGTSAYCTPAQAVLFIDWRWWADLLPPTDNREASSAAVQADPNLLEFLKEGAGLIEFAVMKGGRYTLTDIQAIVTQAGNASKKLASMNAQLSWATAHTAKNPLCNPEDLTAAKTAFMLLDELAAGEMIFPLQEVVDASMEHAIPVWKNPPPNKFSDQARRYFGQRGE